MASGGENGADGVIEVVKDLWAVQIAQSCGVEDTGVEAAVVEGGIDKTAVTESTDNNISVNGTLQTAHDLHSGSAGTKDADNFAPSNEVPATIGAVNIDGVATIPQLNIGPVTVEAAITDAGEPLRKFEAHTSLGDLVVIPNELLSHAASYLNKDDLASMRLVNKKMSSILTHVFGLSLVENRTIYPRYDSISAFFFLLNSNPCLAAFVRSVTLVGEGIKEHEYGHSWAWERMTDLNGLRMKMDDLNILDEVEFEHLQARDLDDAFIHGGGYRTMLSLLLSRLPNLRTVTVRNLKLGEHIPGWAGPSLLQNLSFYYEGINVNEIYYGDWQYDTLHNRVTVYVDEFGEEVVEEGAGPQAGFLDDVMAAMQVHGGSAKLEVLG